MPDTTSTIPQLNVLNLPQLQANPNSRSTLLIKQGGAGPITFQRDVNLAQFASINKQLEAFVQTRFDDLANPLDIRAAVEDTDPDIAGAHGPPQYRAMTLRKGEMIRPRLRMLSRRI